MYELSSVLYSYALEQDMELRFLADREAHAASREKSVEAHARLLPLLDKTAWEALDRYVSEGAIAESMERESLFTAGLAFGLTLSRLG